MRVRLLWVAKSLLSSVLPQQTNMKSRKSVQPTIWKTSPSPCVNARGGGLVLDGSDDDGMGSDTRQVYRRTGAISRRRSELISQRCVRRRIGSRLDMRLDAFGAIAQRIGIAEHAQ